MLDTLLELLALEALPRTGWIQAGLRDVESVGAHSHGVALLVLILGPDVEPEIRVDHAASLAIVHDAPEALIAGLIRTLELNMAITPNPIMSSPMNSGVPGRWNQAKPRSKNR